MAKKLEAFRLSGRVELDAKNAKRDLHDVESQAKSTANSFGKLKGTVGEVSKAGDSSGRGFLSTLGNISEIIQAVPVVGSLVGKLTGPLMDMVQSGLEFNDTIEETQIGLETMLGSLEAAKEHQKELQQFAVITPYTFQNLTRYDAQLIGVGFHAKEIIPTLTALGDALSAVGARDRIDDVIRQLGQMKAKGRASMEELGTIAETGVPVYDILSKQVGMSKAQLMKAIETGKVNSDAAIQFLIEGMEEKYKGLMDRMSKTRQGALSNLQDAAQMRAAEATKSLHDEMTETFGLTTQALNSQAGVTLAAGIGAAAGGVGKVFNAALQLLVTGDVLGELKNVGGNIVSTLTDTVGSGSKQVQDTFRKLAEGGVDAINKVWQINSPSKVAIAQGQSYIEGLEIGLTSNQDRIYEAMKKLFEREPDFLAKLIREATKRGIDPDQLLNVMAVETAGTFNPKARNPTSDASGLIQFLPSTAQGLGTTTAAIRSMSGVEQLDYVFKYLDKMIRQFGPLDTQSRLYASIGAGSVSDDDNAVKFRRGSEAYRKNKGWDVNHDGLIQQWEFGQVAQNALGAGVKFTVNGNPVGNTNPVPVTLVPQAGGDLGGGAGIFRQKVPEAGGDLGGGAGIFRQWPQAGGTLGGGAGIFPPPQAGGDLGGGAGIFRQKSSGGVNAPAIINETLSGDEYEKQLTALIEQILGKKIEEATTAEFRRAMRQAQSMLASGARAQTSAPIVAGSDGPAAVPFPLPMLGNLAKVVPVVADVNKLFGEIQVKQSSVNDLLKEDEKTEKKILTTKQKQAMLLGQGGGTPGFFSGRKYSVQDKEGNDISKPKAAQEAMAGLKAAGEDLKQLGKDTFAQWADGLGGMVNDFVLLGDVGPDALRKVTAQVLASAAQESLVKGIMATADGFVHMFTNPPQSAADFTAAGLYFAIAGGTALIGRAIAGNAFKDKNAQTAGASNVNQQFTDASNPANNFTRREYGGNVYAGHDYLIGERRTEVFRPNVSGRIYPSVSQYESEQRRAMESARMRQSGGGLYGSLFSRLLNTLNRIDAIDPGQLAGVMARRNPRAFSDGYHRSLDADPNAIRGSQRRLGVR
jgi:tape measure domain-containing protein